MRFPARMTVRVPAVALVEEGCAQMEIAIQNAAQLTRRRSRWMFMAVQFYSGGVPGLRS